MSHERERCLDELRVLCCMYIPVAPGILSDLEDLSAKRQPHRKRSMMRSQCGHANVDVDLKIAKSENLKKGRKRCVP